MEKLEAASGALMLKAIEMALDGDPVMRRCLGRIIVLRRGRRVALSLPPIDKAADPAEAIIDGKNRRRY
ncbi:MAG TPA: hypothetical protein VHW66_21030 [Stellaceae bacterium]|jgi:hypothetical protein|nr:hypothetical protein [Stellaceae bacterium]